MYHPPGPTVPRSLWKAVKLLLLKCSHACNGKWRSLFWRVNARITGNHCENIEDDHLRTTLLLDRVQLCKAFLDNQTWSMDEIIDKQVSSWFGPPAPVQFSLWSPLLSSLWSWSFYKVAFSCSCAAEPLPLEDGSLQAAAMLLLTSHLGLVWLDSLEKVRNATNDKGPLPIFTSFYTM